MSENARHTLHLPPRPLTGIRPLAVGAAYLDNFDCLAPVDWSAMIVLAQAFKSLPMEDAGWSESHVYVDNLGATEMGRLWRLSKRHVANADK